MRRLFYRDRRVPRKIYLGVLILPISSWLNSQDEKWKQFHSEEMVLKAIVNKIMYEACNSHSQPRKLNSIRIY